VTYMRLNERDAAYLWDMLEAGRDTLEAIEVGFIRRDDGCGWVQETEELARMLHGLTHTLRTTR